MRFSFGAVGGVVLSIALSLWPLSVRAQLAMPPFVEYDKKLHAAQMAQPLNSELFGDQISLYHGVTEFVVTDIDLPGNSGLPVQLRRRMRIESREEVGLLGGFGTWDIDVPYLYGAFDMNYKWNLGGNGSTSRCSEPWYPNVTGNVYLRDLWNGTFVHLPESGDQSLLYLPNTGNAVPEDGHVYRWGTRDQLRLRCAPATANGYPGESFIGVDAQGTTYTFDVGLERNHGKVHNPLGGITGRVLVYLMASRVEDRHGNWVAYHYSNNRLAGITASDGRTIALAYAGDTIASAQANGRTWHYQYTPPTGVMGLSRFAWLNQVTLPDGSAWRYRHAGTDNGRGGLAVRYHRSDEGREPYTPEIPPPGIFRDRCTEPEFDPYQFILAADHPSGATGTFTFDLRRMHRSGTPENACAQLSNGVFKLFTPDYFDVFSLSRKVIAGPGLEPMTWTYQYGGPGYGRTSKSIPCRTCPSEKTVVVTRPDGSQVWHRFGILYRVNDGRPLGERTYSADNVLLRDLGYEYVSDEDAAGQPFPDSYGLMSGSDDPAKHAIRPLWRTAIGQDGATFAREVQTFDRFARPLRATAYSSLGYRRTDETAYYDDPGRWVLGQTARVVNQDTGLIVSRAEYDGLARPVRIWAFEQLQQTLGYHADGTVATVTDGNGHTTALEQWKRGTPQRIGYADGTAQSAVVDDNGWITAVTDPNGFTRHYQYDAMGRTAQIIHPAGDAVAWHPTVQAFHPVGESEYGIAPGHWRQTVHTGAALRITYFDALWRPLLVHAYDSNDPTQTRQFQRFAYDWEGRTAFASYPSGDSQADRGTWTHRDALGRVVGVAQDSEHGLLFTITEYLPGLRTRVIDPNSQPTVTAYQAFDQPGYDAPVWILHPEGAGTRIERDVFGKPLQIEQGAR